MHGFEGSETNAGLVACLTGFYEKGRRRSPAMPERCAQGQTAKQGAVARLRYGR